MTNVFSGYQRENKCQYICARFFVKWALSQAAKMLSLFSIPNLRWKLFRWFGSTTYNTGELASTNYILWELGKVEDRPFSQSKDKGWCSGNWWLREKWYRKEITEGERRLISYNSHHMDMEFWDTIVMLDILLSLSDFLTMFCRQIKTSKWGAIQSLIPNLNS